MQHLLSRSRTLDEVGAIDKDAHGRGLGSMWGVSRAYKLEADPNNEPRPMAKSAAATKEKKWI